MQERTDAILDGQQPDSARMFFDEPEGLPRTTTVKRLAIIRLLLHDEGTMTAEAICHASEAWQDDGRPRSRSDFRVGNHRPRSGYTLPVRRPIDIRIRVQFPHADTGWHSLNTDTCQVVIAIHQSGTMRISRLEYQLVPADGELPSGALIAVDGLYLFSAPQGGEPMDGTVSDPAHWAVCLFPRCLWQCPALVHGIRFKTRPRERSGRWHLDKRDQVAVATSGTTMLQRG
ncbi:hypothetical protein ADM96_32780 [Burkholderia sp. ST111]|nr:hypothetical protein ADM96_32780 [Burkholderia sp. ST111]